MRTLTLALLATVVAAADPATSAALPPEALGQTVLASGERSELRLAAPAGSTLRWRLTSWDGAEEARGESVADSAGGATVAFTPAAGWHQLAIEGGAEMGLVAVDPALAGKPDPFFGIDAALAWLARDGKRRQGLTDLLVRLGLTTVRERLQWAGLQPEAGRFNQRTWCDDDGIRALYAAKGAELLEVFHDAPPWLTRAGGIYPAELAATADAWTTIVRRFSATTGALEVWNEPDAPGFSYGGTPDQLVSLTRAVAWGARRAKPAVRIVGGVLTKLGTAYAEACVTSGLMQSSDAFSYHDYGDPTDLAARLAKLGTRLAATGAAGIPIWITEAGKPWQHAAERPAVEDDVLSAQWIALRAVEARACGVARIFPFVLTYYREGIRNYGLTARDGSPLRSLAAYAHVARRLAHLAYHGDLAVAGAKRARLFAGGGRAVAVVWMGAPDPATAVPVAELPVVAAFGLDGRRLTVADGRVLAPEGACLLELAPAALTLARLPAAGQALVNDTARARPRLSPLVLQLMPEPGQLTSCQIRYEALRQPAGAHTRLRVRVHQLEEGQREVALTLRAPDGAGAVVDGDRRTVAIGGHGHGETTWQVDVARPGQWRIEASSGGEEVPALVLDLAPELDGDALLARIPAERRHRIPAEEILAADDNIEGKCVQTRSRLEGGGVRFHFDFSKSSGPLPWAFPRLTLKPEARFDRFDALLVRVRGSGPMGVHLFVFEKPQGGAINIGYFTENPVCETDGYWHWAVLPLADLNHCGATDRDPNGTLDRALIDRFSIGVNGRSKICELDLGHIELVRMADLEQARR